MQQEHRVSFRRDLELLVADLADLAELVATAANDASRALLTAQPELAGDVVGRRWAIEMEADRIDAKTSELLTLQAPVARDLRLLVSILRSCSALRRIGDLALHIASVAVRRAPAPAVPDSFTPTVKALADSVSRVTHTASAAIRAGAEPDPGLRQQDDEVDALHRRLLTQLADGSAGLAADTTIDLTLLGRYYERIGDQALNAAGWRRDPVRAAVQAGERR